MHAGNQQLDFEEFYAMQPRKIRDEYTTEQIREWFEAADLDGNGTLCINEFFRWSLLNASQKHGDAALQAAFRQYDKDTTGQLDALEFERVCRDMGFESVAYDIFASLDKDGSGTLNTKEVGEMLIKLGFDADEQYTKQVMAKFDVNGDGRLDPAEFAKLYAFCLANGGRDE